MATRVLGPTGSRRRRRFLIAPLSLLTLIALFLVAGAQAVHNDNLFELGPSAAIPPPPTATTATNIAGDGVFANGPDWQDIFTTTGGLKDVIGAGGAAGANNIPDYLDYGGSAAGFIKDDSAAGGTKDKSTFSGAGTSNKNQDAISTNDCTAGFNPDLTGSACAPWAWNLGNVPAKDDLTNVYSYATIPSSGPFQDHLILYAGLEREDPSGTSHIDVEFFQDSVALANANANGSCVAPAGSTNCRFTGHRTNGDTLLQIEFTNGGAIGSINVREWIDNQYVVVATLAGTGCIGADGNPGDDLCGFTNETTIPNGGWQSFDNHGSPITSLQTNAFTEVGVDITDLFDGTTPCISTFMGKTRSSDSFTAELKDFAGPASFPLCSGQISIRPNAVNEVGATHTFTVKVQKKVGTSTSPAPVGTKPDVSLTGANGAVVVPGTDQCASTGTNASGECTVSFTSNSAGTVTGSATATFSSGGQTFTVTTNGVAPNSAPAVKRFVNGKISIGPDDTNSIGESHTFTVTVQQDDGLTANATGGDAATGFGPVPNGTKPTVTLTDSGGAINNISSNTCASPGTSGGTCTITFTSNTAGTVTGHAAATWTIPKLASEEGSGVSLTRETNNANGNSGDATKVFISGSLAWFKVDNAGVKQAGATFDVCRTRNFNTADSTFTPITQICDSVADDSDGTVGPGLDRDPDAGEFLVTGLRLGTYTVHETAAPPGFEPDPKTETRDVTTATLVTIPLSAAFVNQRPILKLTEFGYTNTPTGTPTAGVRSGTSVYTVKVKNFGGASVAVSGQLAATTDSVGGTLACTGGNTKSLSATLGTTAANNEATFTLSCTYTNLDDASHVTANLSALDYTTNTVTRTASGTPATITFTVQGD